ncbi:MAG: hypothetical protein ACFWTO_07100 [Hafnia paralvei]
MKRFFRIRMKIIVWMQIALQVFFPRYYYIPCYGEFG